MSGRASISRLGAWLPLLTALCMAPASRAQQPPAGLHFIFDASASMCGYVRSNDPDQTLLKLLRFATTQRDASRNQRVLLLRQQGDKPAPRDLMDAPSDVQALAAAGAGRPAANCAEFNGRASNPVQVFETPTFAPRARSIILVSDMQFDETALTAFVDKFREAVGAPLDGQPHSVGLASLGARFAGRYYAVNETQPERRRSGYPLRDHTRPLHVLWLLVGENDLATGRRLLEELGLAGQPRAARLLYGIQFLPVLTEDVAQWLAAPPPPRAASDLLGPPTLKVNQHPGASRPPNALRMCAGARWDKGELQVRVDAKCLDGKPLFDGSVASLVVELPLATKHGLRLTSGSPALSQAGSAMHLKLLTPQPQLDIPLTLAPPPLKLERRNDIRARSIDNDACAVEAAPARPAAGATSAPASWEDRCAARLEGRTYRYDALVEQLAMRAHAATEERARATTVVLRVRRMP